MLRYRLSIMEIYPSTHGSNNIATENKRWNLPECSGINHSEDCNNSIWSEEPVTNVRVQDSIQTVTILPWENSETWFMQFYGMENWISARTKTSILANWNCYEIWDELRWFRRGGSKMRSVVRVLVRRLLLPLQPRSHLGIWTLYPLQP